MKRRATVIIGVLSVTAVLLTPIAAMATFPSSNGKLAFQRGGDIWIASQQVTSPTEPSLIERRLTFNGISRNPRWSSDGRRLAYNTTTGVIKTMSAWGTNRRNVVVGHAYQPAWSPELPSGERIVFVKRPVGKEGDLWTVPARGGIPRRLTSDGAANCGVMWPSWSPDGTTIAYHRTMRGPDHVCRSGDDRTQVIVLTLATMQRRVVPIPTLDEFGDPILWTQLVTAPDFSAGGDRVLFAMMLGGDGCLQFLGWYDLASGRSSTEEWGYQCEGGPTLIDVGPAPAGGEWSILQDWSDSRHVTITYDCPGVPAAGGCWTESFAGRNAWVAPDVQPQPVRR